MLPSRRICRGSQVDLPAPVGALSKTCGACSKAASSSGRTTATGKEDTYGSRGLTLIGVHCSIGAYHYRVLRMSESKRLFFAIELPTTLQRQIVRWRASHFPAEAGRPCYSSPTCCGRRPRAAAVIRARSRFIPTLPCCATRVRPLPSRHRAFTGPFR